MTQGGQFVARFAVSADNEKSMRKARNAQRILIVATLLVWLVLTAVAVSGWVLTNSWSGFAAIALVALFFLAMAAGAWHDLLKLKPFQQRVRSGEPGLILSPQGLCVSVPHGSGQVVLPFAVVASISRTNRPPGWEVRVAHDVDGAPGVSGWQDLSWPARRYRRLRLPVDLLDADPAKLDAAFGYFSDGRLRLA